MVINTYIEVQAYGDMNVYTECIMTHSDKLIIKDILEEFCIIQDIPTWHGLDYRILAKTTEDFISFLELKGFTKLNTQKVIFCD